MIDIGNAKPDEPIVTLNSRSDGEFKGQRCFPIEEMILRILWRDGKWGFCGAIDATDQHLKLKE